MIKVYKDNHELEVSRNTYETRLKKLGYKIKEKIFKKNEEDKKNKNNKGEL